MAGVVLAAGMSQRMGGNKLLLDLGGQPVVRWAVRRALDAGLAPVLVVFGYEADRVQNVLEGLAYEPVVNREYEQGIDRSVKIGIAHVPDDADAAVVMLADMPLVTAEMIAATVSRYRETGAPLVISEYDGVCAPPTLYDRSLFCEFAAADGRGEGCGKRIVKRHRDVAVALAFRGDAITDLDVPEDYARVQSTFAGAVT